MKARRKILLVFALAVVVLLASIAVVSRSHQSAERYRAQLSHESMELQTWFRIEIAVSRFAKELADVFLMEDVVDTFDEQQRAEIEVRTHFASLARQIASTVEMPASVNGKEKLLLRTMARFEDLSRGARQLRVLAVQGVEADELRGEIGVILEEVYEERLLRDIAEAISISARSVRHLRDEATVSAEESYSLTVALAGVSALFALLIVVVSCEILGRPLQALVTATNAVAASDYSHRLSLGRADELGELAMAFDGMLDRLEATRASQRAFYDVLTHELRSPINSVLGFIDLALDEDVPELNPTTRRNLERANTSAKRLRRLIDDTLELSRLRSGGVAVREETFSVREIADETFHAAQQLEPRKPIAYELEVDATVSHITSDPSRLNQILMNLLSNAVKYTTSGTVRMSVRRVAGDRVEFVVSDTGCGIPADKLESVFEPFSLLDTNVGALQGSTGLGLAIVREMTIHLEGQVAIESVVDAGTTVRVELPDLASG